MDQQQSSDVLAKCAAVSRNEGDTDTADAMVQRLAHAAHRSQSEDDADCLKRVLARARQLASRGGNEAAAESYAEALRVVESALGATDSQMVGHLSNAARCGLNASFYKNAPAGYLRLRRLVQELYASDHQLAATARYYVRSCQTNIRLTNSTKHLQVHLNEMLRHSQGRLVVAAAGRADCIRAVAPRLVARGRRAAASRQLESAIALRPQNADPYNDLALLENQRYAVDLRDAGDSGRAAAVLIRLVVERNRRSAWGAEAENPGCPDGHGNVPFCAGAGAICSRSVRAGRLACQPQPGRRTRRCLVDDPQERDWCSTVPQPSIRSRP